MATYVCCPAAVETGGPEALHQLVSELNGAGEEAYVSYLPFDGSQEVTAAYRGYCGPGRKPVDAPGNCVVVPETMTYLVPRFKHAVTAVWWLSVDGYYGRNHSSLLGDVARYGYRWATGACVAMRKLRGSLHYAQSVFAREHLARRGVRASMLSDYINAELCSRVEGTARRPCVLYNPKKRLHVTEALKRHMPEIPFVPLQGLQRGQLSEVLRASMVYIDFGHHPGKDRLPREAALAGCVVITNRRGSAAFAQDVPLPDRYKIDDSRVGFEEECRRVVLGVFADFGAAASACEPLVRSVALQRDVFSAEVRSLVVDLRGRPSEVA